jgi:hypothetical protein
MKDAFITGAIEDNASLYLAEKLQTQNLYSLQTNGQLPIRQTATVITKT